MKNSASSQKNSAIIYVIAAASIIVAATIIPSGKKNTTKGNAPAHTALPVMPAAKADLPAVTQALKLKKEGKKIGNEVLAKTTSSATILEEQKKEAAAKLAALPLFFRKNMGQWDKEILYRGNSQGKHVTIMKDKVSFCSTREIEEEENEEAEKKEAGAIHNDEQKEQGTGDEYQFLVWNLHFKGMNTNAVITAEGEAESHTNYLFGNDPSKWIVNVPDVKIVKYRNIYNNIDLHYYGRPNNELEYDYIIQPGGKVEDIQMQLEGVKGLSINENGELEITTDWGVVKEKAPFAYQEDMNARRQPTPTHYRIINQNTFGFAVAGTYNKNAPLVIDPVSMVWSTWVGGAGASVNYSYAITVDGSGNSYITGKGISSYPTTPGAFSQTASSGTSVFVTKLNAAGTALVYSTFLGTTGNSTGNAIAVNAAGEAFVTGSTNSQTFPTFPAGAFQTTLTGCSFGLCTFGAFVTRLNTAGSVLVYSTFLRGVTSGTSRGDGIAILADEAYVTGTTNSANFPFTTGAYRTTLSGSSDAFVTKLNTTGTAPLVYSTYLGGTGGEGGRGIAVNSAGEAFIIGYTSSTVPAGFLTTAGVIQPAYGGGFVDGFVTRFNAAGTGLVYSTFLGGSGDDVQGNNTGLTAGAIVINSANEAFVSGITESTDFPTTLGAYRQTSVGGTSDAFVTKLNSTGGGVYSTYLGGTAMDVAYGIGVNPAGEAYVSGHTMSADFPTLTAYDATYGGGCCGSGDVFVTTLNVAGSAILCSSFVGGSSQEYGAPRLALIPGNPDAVLVTVTTHSADFPTTVGVFQGTPTPKPNGASDDPAVFKIAGCAISPLPIGLLNFTANCSTTPNTVRVAWSTATETNNDYFTIERSTDAVAWETAGTVKGAGNSSATRNYEFIDNVRNFLPPSGGGGALYYRLKQTDFDGKSETFSSKQVAVDVTECAVKVFPNPAGNTLNVPYTAEQDGEITLQVYDVIGKLVKESRVLGIKGNNKFTIDLTTVAQGMYVLRVKNGGKEHNEKFIKQ